MDSKTTFSTYVAFLRALYLIHQTHHWQSKGENFFGNHLLFERIYGEVADQVDAAAEKAIGIFDVSSLNLSEQLQIISKICSKYASPDPNECVMQSLKAELAFLKVSDSVRFTLEKSGVLSTGLDNLIADFADKSEGRIYLLKQSIS